MPRAPRGFRGRGPRHDETERRQDAFARHVVPEIPLLLRVARALAGGEAEDVVQDTLLRAYRAIDRFDGRHPRAWLLTILRNSAANHHRKRTPSPARGADLAESPLGELPSNEAGPEQQVLDGTFEEAVETALALLPAKARQVVELVDVRGLTYEEAALALHVPIGTVMSRLHRARQRMRRQLDPPRRGEQT
jgi:RNA polymerase sigma-70 factor (ECF subfamily)